MEKLTNNQLSAKQTFCIMAMKYHLENGGSLDGFIRYATIGIKSRATIHRMIKEIKHLYGAHLSNDIEVIQRMEYRDILRDFLGVNQGNI